MLDEELLNATTLILCVLASFSHFIIKYFFYLFTKYECSVLDIESSFPDSSQLWLNLTTDGNKIYDNKLFSMQTLLFFSFREF